MAKVSFRQQRSSTAIALHHKSGLPILLADDVGAVKPPGTGESALGESIQRPTGRYLEFEFLDLVARVFRAQGFDVQQEVRRLQDRRRVEADLLLTADNGVKTVVEVKLYRSRARYIPDGSKAIAQVRNAQVVFQADHAMLVTNLYRDWIRPSGAIDDGVILVGIDDLAELAITPELREEIGRVDEELSSALRDFDSAGLARPKVPFAPSVLHMRVTPPAQTSDTPVPARGAVLVTELSEIKPGKAFKQKLPSTGREGVNWRLFEDVCYEALQYVFEGVLGNWGTQEAVAGDDSRLDARAKIEGSDVFCRTLIEHFGTRHILFEFKNYQDKIGANLIHITEKYLYANALRGAAVIISPKGFSDPANRAAHGALRDVGKLMLDLDVPLLCKLLEAKDLAQPPGAEMERLMDAFLLEVGR